MAVTIDALKEYLRLPPDSTEDLVGYLAAAISKAKAAGIPEFKNNAQYDMFIMALAGMNYENRGMAFGGSYQATAEENARKLINSYVLELRYATEDGDEG
jgi:hypothetical protein